MDVLALIVMVTGAAVFIGVALSIGRRPKDDVEKKHARDGLKSPQ